jgi:hypothetical protein
MISANTEMNPIGSLVGEAELQEFLHRKGEYKP